MSYSNDWSVTDITGITTLKDCYKWNGTARLNTVPGLLRLENYKNDTNAIEINSDIFPGSTKIQYYDIPKYFINNKSICSVGYADPATENNAYNYSSPVEYPGATKTNLDIWGFKWYPNIPYPAWTDNTTGVYKNWDYVTTSTRNYYSVIADTNCSFNTTWRMYSEEKYNTDILESSTLTIPDVCSYYNNSYGSVPTVTNVIQNHSIITNISDKTGRYILKNSTLTATIEGYPVYVWGVGYNPTSYMYGYIKSSDLGITSSQILLYSPDSSTQDYDYITINGTKYYYQVQTSGQTDNPWSKTYLYGVSRQSRPYSLAQEFIPYFRTNFRMFVKTNGNDSPFTILSYTSTVSQNSAGQFIGFYYDTDDITYGKPTFHFLGISSSSQQANTYDFPSAYSSVYKGNYHNLISSSIFTRFCFQDQSNDHNKFKVELFEGSNRSFDSTDFGTVSWTLPVLYSQVGGSFAKIKRISKTDTGFELTGIFSYYDDQITFPVIWSQEPKIWLREEINNTVGVYYTLYFGSYRTPLTKDLMDMYGKNFDLTIYTSSTRSTVAHTFSFRPSDFPTVDGSETVLDYEDLDSGCYLHLQRISEDNYRIYLGKIDGGGELIGPAYEFNKFYWLPWDTRKEERPKTIMLTYTLSNSSAIVSSALGLYNGTTYTATVSGNVATFEVDYVNATDFTLTSLTISNNYSLTQTLPLYTGMRRDDIGRTRNVTVGVASRSWDNVEGLDSEDDGSSEYDHRSWYFTAPAGYVTSYVGYYVQDGIRGEISQHSVGPLETKVSVFTIELRENDPSYIEVTLTNADGQTAIRYYGTEQLTTVYVQPKYNNTNVTPTAASITFNGNTYSNYILEDGKAKFILPYYNITSNYCQISDVTGSGYVFESGQSDNLTLYGTKTLNAYMNVFGWSGVIGVQQNEDDNNYYTYDIIIPKGFVQSVYAYYIDNDYTKTTVNITPGSNDTSVTILGRGALAAQPRYIWARVYHDNSSYEDRDWQTMPITTIKVEASAGTIEEAWISFNGQTHYSDNEVNGYIVFEIPYYDISDNTCTITAVTVPGYTMNQSNSASAQPGGTLILTATMVQSGWNGVYLGTQSADEGYIWWTLFVPKGFLSYIDYYYIDTAGVKTEVRENVPSDITAMQLAYDAETPSYIDYIYCEAYATDQSMRFYEHNSYPLTPVTITSQYNALSSIIYTWRGAAYTANATNGTITLNLDMVGVSGTSANLIILNTDITAINGYGYAGDSYNQTITRHAGASNNFQITGFNAHDFNNVSIDVYSEPGEYTHEQYVLVNNSGYTIDYTGYVIIGTQTQSSGTWTWSYSRTNVSGTTASQTSIGPMAYQENTQSLQYAEITYSAGNQSRTISRGTYPQTTVYIDYPNITSITYRSGSGTSMTTTTVSNLYQGASFVVDLVEKDPTFAIINASCSGGYAFQSASPVTELVSGGNYYPRIDVDRVVRIARSTGQVKIYGANNCSMSGTYQWYFDDGSVGSVWDFSLSKLGEREIDTYDYDEGGDDIVYATKIAITITNSQNSANQIWSGSFDIYV